MHILAPAGRLTSFTRFVLALLVILATSAGRAGAQEKVYSPEQLTQLPKIASTTDAIAAIEAEYPAELKASKVTGRVQLRFIVNADGSVDASSVKVVAATNEQLGSAAARAVKRIHFQPGKVGDSTVRTVVMFPLSFGS
jgi:TonB family protein